MKKFYFEQLKKLKLFEKLKILQKLLCGFFINFTPRHPLHIKAIIILLQINSHLVLNTIQKALILLIQNFGIHFNHNTGLLIIVIINFQTQANQLNFYHPQNNLL